MADFKDIPIILSIFGADVCRRVQKSSRLDGLLFVRIICCQFRALLAPFVRNERN
jgi:hypothetical protein